MSVSAAQSLDRNAIPWLFFAGLMTALPHSNHQPLWLSLVIACLFAASGWMWWRHERLPGRWPLAILVVLACAGIFLEFQTLLGRDAGVSMLSLLMSMKLFELRSRRDAYVLIMLGYFLLLTHYFYSQSIPTGIWLLTTLLLLTATLIRLHGGPASGLRPSLRYGAIMLGQALPFMIILYLLFPRVAGPLWGLPQDAHAGKMGLSDQMSPGNISELALSTEIAFRARFSGAAPDQKQLYWRGPVLETYDGSSWYQTTGQRGQAAAPEVEFLGPLLEYTLTLEAHNQRWLLALDAPVKWPEEATLSSHMIVLSKTPLRERQRFELSSTLGYRFNAEEYASVRQRNLNLPQGFNPRTLALASQWRSLDSSPEKLVERAITYFREEPFAYTLTPPLLGQDGVDDFLFTTRKGFCEHYAAAFVVLMRASRVPARVVTGYQGGELNPLDGNFVIRQSDAHAWSEVWMSGKGWIRVDPTAAVSPARVESGRRSAVVTGGALPGIMQMDILRYRWEALNNAWNQIVLGYNAQRQRALMSQLGVDPDWRNLTAILSGTCGVALFLLLLWAIRHRPRVDPAQKLWRKALNKLHRHGFVSSQADAPLTIARRIASEYPPLANAVGEIVEAYCLTRYGSRSDYLPRLRSAVNRLP